jgi:tetratricopeptide (TPR) repeat protein
LAGAVCFAAEGPARRDRQKWASQADELMAKKNYADAIPLLEKATAPGASKSDLLGWYSRLGRCYEFTRNYQKALAAYQEAYALRPNGLDQMLDMARIYDLVDLKDNAIDLFQKILQRDKSRKDVVFALANLYMRSGRIDQAKDYTKKALESDPHDPASQRLMAAIEENEGKLESAAHRWEGLLATRPSAEDFLHLGRLWAEQDQYDLAEINFRKALTQGAPAPDVNFQRGVMAWHLGKTSEAEKFFRDAQKGRPGWDAAVFFEAMVRQQEGDKSRALALMKNVQAKTESPFLKDVAGRFQEIAVSTTSSSAPAANRKARN